MRRFTAYHPLAAFALVFLASPFLAVWFFAKSIIALAKIFRRLTNRLYSANHANPAFGPGRTVGVNRAADLRAARATQRR